MSDFISLVIEMYRLNAITLDKCAELLDMDIEECKRLLHRRGIKV